MASTPTSELPNLGDIFAQVLVRVPFEQQPLLIATAERLAARRYRMWADDSAVAPHKADLLACAEREEQIAGRVENLFPAAASVQRALLEQNPDLEELNRSLFAGRPLTEQFTIQARGERLGAATWRAFAKRAENDAARDTFLRCAELEEVSAEVLEALLRQS